MNIRKAYRNAGMKLRKMFGWHKVSRDDLLEEVFRRAPDEYTWSPTGEDIRGWVLPASYLRGPYADYDLWRQCRM